VAEATSLAKGPLLRRIAGVDEELLSEVPTDRFRYSRLGGVIVGTASIATISMWLALGEITGHTTLLLAPIAVLWGLFIGNLDAWIVASLHGTRWRQHAWIVLPRLALAIIFGFLIAEPLVLRAFAPAIENDIKGARQTQLRALETHLKTCNPSNGEVPPPALDCSDAQIVVNEASPKAISGQIEALSKQRATLERGVASNDAHQEKLERKAQLECTGAHGSGFSGEFGVGINCGRDREQADHFRTENRTGAESAQLIAVRHQLRELTPRLRSATQSFERAVSSVIAQKVAERRRDQGHIGLLERLYSLRQLVARNWYLFAAEWFLRLLFVTIDCLPVIVKVTGGSTAYDHLLDRRLNAREAIFSSRQETAVKAVTSQNDVKQYQLERKAQDEIDRIDSELRLDNARRNLEIDAAIDEFTERLLREQRAATAARRKRFVVDEPSRPAGVGGTEH
jgi:hypothetical protein